MSLKGIEALTDKGVSLQREANEDSFFVVSARIADEPVHVGVVCDGLGGLKQGAVASNFVITNISNYLVEIASDLTSYDVLVAKLTQRVREINYELFMNNKRDGIKKCTTLVMSIVSEKYATLMHVGDSRAYLVRAAGDQTYVKKLTVDHSHVEYLYQQGKIKELPPENASTRSKLLACMGYEDTLQYSIKKIAVVKGDVLILVSDGYWGYATTQDYIDLARGTTSLSESFGQIIDRGTQDNITAVILRV